MVTRTGVKVLDFGLATLAVAQEDPSVPGETASLLKSADHALVGTLPYMAPEQIEGCRIDARCDLFAFGAIVYEMATGRRAFQGTSQASLMAAILERTPPPIADGRPLTPPGFERLVQKCLAKDPDARWQSASDVADELRWLSHGAAATPAAQPPVSRRSARPLWWVAAATVGIAGAGLWLWNTRGRSGEAPPVEAIHQQVTFSGDVLTASLSPDGRSVAFAAGRTGSYRVVVRDISTGQELEVVKGPVVLDIKWVPDGSRIAVAGGPGGQQPRVWLFSRLGGPPRLVEGARAGSIAISPDGTRVVTAEQTQGVSVVALAGGKPRRIPGSELIGLLGIDWTRPDRLLVPMAIPDGTDAVMAGSPDGEGLKAVFPSKVGIRAVCASPVSDAFYAFIGARLERIRLVEGTAQPPEVMLTGLAPFDSEVRTCSLSADGERLVHLRGVNYANVWRLDLNQPGRSAVALTKGTSRYRAPHFSKDGQFLVYAGGPSAEILKIALSGGQPIPLTKGATPVWSPDGTRLAFLSDRASKIWVGDTDGQRAVELPGAEVNGDFLTWLPDGRLAWQMKGGRNIQIRDLESGRDDFLIKDPSVGWIFQPRFSVRGDSVAVFWNRNWSLNQRGLWTLSWPDRAERFLAPDLYPDGWSPDGQWIYAHREGSRSIVRVRAKTGAIEPVGDFPIGGLASFACDVSRDGSAIVCSLDETNSDAWMIRHFDSGGASATTR